MCNRVFASEAKKCLFQKTKEILFTYHYNIEMKDFDFGNKSFSDNAGVIVNNKGEMKGIFSFLCYFWFVCHFLEKDLIKLRTFFDL